MEELQYQTEIDKLLKQTVCDIYVQTPDFEKIKESILAAASTSYDAINTYVINAVSSGVSADAAIICVDLFLKMKYAQ